MGDWELLSFVEVFHTGFLLNFTGRTLEKTLLVSGFCNLFTLRRSRMVWGRWRRELCPMNPKTRLRTDPGYCIMRQHKNAYIDADG